MQRLPRQLKLFFITLYEHFIDDGCMGRAAELTYTSLLSLVPLMAVSFAIFAAFPLFKTLSGEVQNFIFNHFVATSGEVIQAYLQRFLAQATNLSAIGFLFLLITAILMMYNMEQAFNAIWHVKIQRRGISAFLLYWAILTLAPIMLGLSLLLSSYLGSIALVTKVITTLGLTKAMLTILPFCLTTLFFALLYIAVPNCKVPIRQGLIGALVAAVLFEIAKLGFALYVLNFPTYTLLYGALATIPVFLLWIYICWVIILFGAVLTYVLSVDHQYRSDHKLDGFTHCYRWLGYFWQAMKKGQALSLPKLVAMDNDGYAVPPEQQLELMSKLQLIQPTQNGRYVLSRDLSQLTLADLHRILPWRLPQSDELEHSDNEPEQALYQIVRNVTDINKPMMNVPLKALYHVEDNED